MPNSVIGSHAKNDFHISRSRFIIIDWLLAEQIRQEPQREQVVRERVVEKITARIMKMTALKKKQGNIKNANSRNIAGNLVIHIEKLLEVKNLLWNCYLL